MEKTLKPSLRFKGFTDAWELCKLGDIGTFKSNGVDKLSKPNEIPVNLLNYMDVYNRREISNKNASDLMQVTAKQSQLVENNVLKNDVFFTPTSETPDDIGRVYVIEETLNNTVYSYHLMRFRPKDNVFYPNFPNYSLMTPHVREQFFISAKGVQRYVISKADFEAIENYIPEYLEQAKIGEMFRSIDSLITLHQRKHEKLMNVKKALLDKMFPKNGEVVPQLRFKGFTDTWEQRKFSDISSRESYMQESSYDIPSVEYEDVIAEEGRLNKNIKKKESRKKGISFDGTQVLYGKLRPYLHNWLNPDFSGVAVGDWWVLKPINADKNFVYRLIQTQKFDDIANQSAGSKMPRADWNLISNSTFAIPASLEEQSKIGSTFDKIDNLITLHQRKYEKLINIKKALLQKMFV